ncbi:hypothetical protein [Leptospira stimsonii]|uniref:DUF8156 domain-containing protein n=1 Tax=Leptospira stimsonii TaxID=2202203 RepID=A0ABY2N9X7_9LEPT|nr:hypothetical protein [Leptospira stimsonii]TGK18859.1 hypothetical protein EHO98_12165 [Leptospira stimsonii]TGM18972.1 hypothetical protein EHQ90_05455 [Leptospira stimsonii]
MGRTVRPYSNEIEGAKERFNDFRRALPRKDQEAFDDIMRMAKGHLAAGVMASNPYSIETILLTALVKMRTELNELKKLNERNV